MSKSVFLSLGGNHENTKDLLDLVERKLSKFSLIKIQVSPYYITPPWGFETENDFINCVMRLEVRFSALKFLGLIHSLEKELGRVRIGGGYTSRPIDIDIIYFGDRVIENEELTIPHPRMYNRKFVLVPLNDIASFWIDPKLKINVNKLLEKCKDSSEIVKY